jgi:hypothetical protein
VVAATFPRRIPSSLGMLDTGQKFIGGRHGTTSYNTKGNQACEIQLNVEGYASVPTG